MVSKLDRKLYSLFEEIYNGYNENYIQKKYEEYANLSKERIQLLLILFDYEHPIGSHADTFRSQFINGYYTPEIIETIEIPELFPEIFHNLLFEEWDNSQKEMYKMILDEIQTKPGKKNVSKIQRMKYKKQAKTIPEICNTPFWNISRPNTIIIKQDGYFYCLDITKILERISNENPLTNYELNKPLPMYIENKLKLRYANEIKQIKEGTYVELKHSATEKEKTDLLDTLEKLKTYRANLNEEKVIKKGIQILGKIPNTIIPLIIQKRLRKEPGQNTIQWLDTNIEFIQNTIEYMNKENIEEKEEETETIEQEIKEEEALGINKKDIRTHPAEYFIQKHILSNRFLVSDIIENYKKRLNLLKNEIFEQLKDVENVNERKKLNDYLKDINKINHQIDEKISSFPGLIDILNDKLKIVQDIIDSSNSIQLRIVLEPELNYYDINNLRNQEKTILDEISKIEQIQFEYLNQ